MSAQRMTTRMRMSDDNVEPNQPGGLSQSVVSGDAITIKQNKNRCGLKNG